MDQRCTDCGHLLPGCGCPLLRDGGWPVTGVQLTIDQAMEDGNVPAVSGDPDRAEFRFPAPQPEGEWAYILDDMGVAYGRAPWWPFRDVDKQREREQNFWRKRKGIPLPAKDCGTVAVRISPDSAYRSWGCEYVTVWPDEQQSHLAAADLTLRIRERGMGADAVRCEAALDLRAGTFELRRCPDVVRKQGEAKAAKILAFLAAERDRRESGARKPVDAYDRWTEGSMQ
jgi:hypothetical protein